MHKVNHSKGSKRRSTVSQFPSPLPDAELTYPGVCTVFRRSRGRGSERGRWGALAAPLWPGVARAVLLQVTLCSWLSAGIRFPETPLNPGQSPSRVPWPGVFQVWVLHPSTPESETRGSSEADPSPASSPWSGLPGRCPNSHQETWGSRQIFIPVQLRAELQGRVLFTQR